jgi:DNA-nicking Smr family endonuclease
MPKQPKRIESEPPWMRLGPAADDPDEGDDGERLWKKIAEGVKPLGETKHKRHAPPAAPARPARVERSSGPQAPAEAARTPPLPPRRAAAPPAPPPLVPGQLAGLDRRSGERLRKGQMPVEAKLDLHGMTQEGAHASVVRFVESQHAIGARCVLIVTGKGGRAADLLRPKPAAGRGVLKEALPRWLNEPRLRARVIAVQPASRAHGGEGALYVLLKRKR